MSIIGEYNQLLRDKYKEIASEEQPVFFVDYGFSLFQQMFESGNINRVKTGFKLTKIKFLTSKIPYFIWPSFKENKNKRKKNLLDKIKRESIDIENEKTGKQKPNVHYVKFKLASGNAMFDLGTPGDRTGVFHFEFTEKGNTYHAVYCCYISGVKNEKVTILCCSNEVLNKIHFEQKKIFAKQQKPKFGIFTGTMTNDGRLIYKKELINPKLKPTFHRAVKEIESDLNYFFNNVDYLISQGEKGTRKILIGGVQGSGKSTVIANLINKRREKCSILFAPSLEELVVHQALCAKYLVPCITILEDCENSFNDGNSVLLNTLSGQLEPLNKAGTYTIFTTNHPDRISDRIKHRPERIDDIFILSTLNKKDSLDVVKYYFGKFLPKDYDFTNINEFDGYTGAEVMQIAALVKKYADYKKLVYKDIDLKFIKRCIKTNDEKYKKLQLIDTSKTKLASNKTDTIGFKNMFSEEESEEQFEMEELNS